MDAASGKSNMPLIMSWTFGGVFLLFAFLGFLLYSSHYGSGDLVRPYQPGDTHSEFSKALREEVSGLSAGYADQIKLILSAFGVVSFLVTYQSKRGQAVSGRAWGLLCFGITVLIAGLIVCLYGKELLTVMVIRNSVKLDVAALTVSRFLGYVCLTVAAASFGFFSIELIPVAPPAGVTSNLPDNEDD